MPQLMPLMWSLSVIMSFFLIFVLVEMFYYMEYSVNFLKNGKIINMMNYKW